MLEVECRKRELEDFINKRREDIESYLHEKEKASEEEKKRELLYISCLKEDLVKEQEHVALALKKLENKKLEIKLDRKQGTRHGQSYRVLLQSFRCKELN